MHLNGLAWTEACKQLRYCNMGCWTRDLVMLEHPECWSSAPLARVLDQPKLLFA